MVRLPPPMPWRPRRRGRRRRGRRWWPRYGEALPRGMGGHDARLPGGVGNEALLAEGRHSGGAIWRLASRAHGRTQRPWWPNVGRFHISRWGRWSQRRRGDRCNVHALGRHGTARSVSCQQGRRWSCGFFASFLAGRRSSRFLAGLRRVFANLSGVYASLTGLLGTVFAWIGCYYRSFASSNVDDDGIVVHCDADCRNRRQERRSACRGRNLDGWRLDRWSHVLHGTSVTLVVARSSRSFGHSDCLAFRASRADRCRRRRGPVDRVKCGAGRRWFGQVLHLLRGLPT
mmetsp:Transcript_84564/g.235920  ORF Transcript_84564/g.235920 Transcript_84564/m.235920 type:complete len:287 (-) Transcript_84564:254-1114(-)